MNKKTPDFIEGQLTEKYPELMHLDCWEFEPHPSEEDVYNFEILFRSGIGKGDNHLNFLATCTDNACGLLPWQGDIADILTLNKNYRLSFEIVDEDWGTLTWFVVRVKNTIYFERHRDIAGGVEFTRWFYFKHLDQLVMLQKVNRVD